MRTATININGKERLLCFSMRAILAVNDRYGGVEKIGAALSGESVSQNLQEAIWLISTMLEAGARYAALSGMDNPPALSCEELYDLCGADDLAELRGKIVETIVRGRDVHVEVEPEKNGTAAQGSA